MTSADLVIAISPAVAGRPSEEGKQMLLHFRSTMVRASHPGQILELLKALPMVPKAENTKLLVYAKGDIPSLIEGILGLKDTLLAVELLEITTHQHAEAPLPQTILDYLPHWVNHLDLKTNIELLERVPRWIQERLKGSAAACRTVGATS